MPLWAIIALVVSTAAIPAIQYYQGEKALDEAKKAQESLKPLGEQQMVIAKQATLMIVAGVVLVAMLWISRKKV